MRIVYASRRPPYPLFLGGAARCAHRLLLSLVKDHGADCLAVGAGDYEVSPWPLPPPAEHAALGIRAISPTPLDEADGAIAIDCGYPICLLPDFPRALARLLDERRPDIVWSQLEGAHDVLGAARKRGIAGLLYVHDAEGDPRALRATADLGCHVVCSSAFLAREVSRVIGRPARVVYPASDWYFGTVGDPHGFVTMVNPHAVKGLETFLEIARRMRKQRFLLQESWKLGDAALVALRERLAALPNVMFQHRVSDMRQVYARTRLLLVPSVWEEGFGMVAVEAQSCGIPVIASNRGGLPESVGEGGVLVDDFRNVDTWVVAIEAMLNDEAAYRELAARALAYARSPAFSPNRLSQRFLEVCDGAPPRSGAVARSVRTLRSGLARAPFLGRLLQRAGR